MFFDDFMLRHHTGFQRFVMRFVILFLEYRVASVAVMTKKDVGRTNIWATLWIICLVAVPLSTIRACDK